jgi:hypothetical protein|tara:strand:- start:220 stop:729 length:510 start_codon:yes stop_codon:yes gene_type:complete
MNEWEEDIEYEDPFKKIQLDIDECHRRMDAISSYQDEWIKSDIDECHRRVDAISSYQVNQCMKMILDLDYIVCSDRYRSEEMIQANSMIIDSISIRQNMFAELINYLIKHFDLDSEERVLDIEKNYLKEDKNKFDIATLELEKIDATFQEELNKRKDFIDEFLKTSLKK